MNARKLLSAAKAVEAAYIEDVFSTYLYTGNSSTQTITNGIDLSGKGGLVWTKRRDNVGSHKLIDSARGWTVGSGVGQSSPVLNSDTTNAQAVSTSGTGGPYDITSVSSTGYTIGPDWNGNGNTNTATYVSWTFRKQAKFFDVVTYTGNGVAGRTVAHNLGSVPGCVIIKKTSTTSNWPVYHVGTGFDFACILNGTEASGTTTRSPVSAVSATTITLNSAATDNFGDTNPNANGVTYVAYLFAHDAGGFGASGSDNVISCGSFTTDGSGNATVTLGYEPQWILRKTTAIADNWYLQDTMRGMAYSGFSYLSANLSNAEASLPGDYIVPNSTGFTVKAFNASTTYIYIAIRRGPMKTPTTGTSVYNAIARTGTGATATVSGVGFAPDAVLFKARNSASLSYYFGDKLRGTSPYLATSDTAAETTSTIVITGYGNNSISVGTSGIINGVQDYINYFFQRAPGFFDVVIPTSTSTGTVVNSHGLGVTPELVIFKARSATQDWFVESPFIGTIGTYQCFLNLPNARGLAAYLQSLSSTTFTTSGINPSAYVFYLFASVAGVSKVGSYTGTGNTLQIDCGFTGGARFVLIKRTDSTGDWYVWDSARGIVAGNDPYLLLNSTAAEVTSTDYVDTYSAGFEISSTAPAAINANGGSFIFLAIA